MCSNKDIFPSGITHTRMFCCSGVNFEVVYTESENMCYELQEEEVDDEDISDTENTAMPTCK